MDWTTFNGGRTITPYIIIIYQTVGSIKIANVTQTEEILQTGGSVQLRKLKKLTEYVVEVAAENSVGRSPFGTGQCLTTCGEFG